MSQKEIIDDDTSFRSLTEIEEQRLAIWKKEYSENYKQVNKAQWAIIGIMVIEVVLAFIRAGNNSIGTGEILLTAFALLLYAIALFITFSRVVEGLVIALTLYAIIIILSLVGDPMNLLRGPFLKLLVLGFLINGISHARRNVKVLEEIKALGGEAPAHKLI